MAKSDRRDIDQIGPRDKHMVLESLTEHSGFLIYAELWRRKVDAEITKEILDVNTDDAKTRILKEARACLVESFDPEKVLAVAITQTRTEVTRQIVEEEEKARAKR